MFKVLFAANLFIGLSNCYFSNEFNTDSDVSFLLRIRNRKFQDEETFSIQMKENIENSAFNPSKPIILLVHGFTEDRTVKHHLKLSKAILDAKDVNLFFVDWGVGAKTFDYGLAKSRVNPVSETIANFIKYLREKYSINYDSVSCIGFSLGAHICGLIGMYMDGEKIKKVVGLDPAGVLFDVKNSSDRINPESAKYVECIHTGYYLGIRAHVCQSDFFMNGGSKQPGCENFMGIDNLPCSHHRSVTYYTEALHQQNAFRGNKCDELKGAVSGRCSNEFGAYMGNEENDEKQLTGMFYVATNANRPYGRGNE